MSFETEGHLMSYLAWGCPSSETSDYKPILYVIDPNGETSRFYNMIYEDVNKFNRSENDKWNLKFTNFTGGFNLSTMDLSDESIKPFYREIIDEGNVNSVRVAGYCASLSVWSFALFTQVYTPEQTKRFMLDDNEFPIYTHARDFFPGGHWMEQWAMLNLSKYLFARAVAFWIKQKVKHAFETESERFKTAMNQNAKSNNQRLPPLHLTSTVTCRQRPDTSQYKLSVQKEDHEPRDVQILPSVGVKDPPPRSPASPLMSDQLSKLTLSNAAWVDSTDTREHVKLTHELSEGSIVKTELFILTDRTWVSVSPGAQVKHSPRQVQNFRRQFREGMDKDVIQHNDQYVTIRIMRKDDKQLRTWLECDTVSEVVILEPEIGTLSLQYKNETQGYYHYILHSRFVNNKMALQYIARTQKSPPPVYRQNGTPKPLGTSWFVINESHADTENKYENEALAVMIESRYVSNQTQIQEALRLDPFYQTPNPLFVILDAPVLAANIETQTPLQIRLTNGKWMQAENPYETVTASFHTGNNLHTTMYSYYPDP